MCNCTYTIPLAQYLPYRPIILPPGAVNFIPLLTFCLKFGYHLRLLRALEVLPLLEIRDLLNVLLESIEMHHSALLTN